MEDLMYKISEKIKDIQANKHSQLIKIIIKKFLLFINI